MDVYQKVTDSILASLEAGVLPWKPSWQPGSTGNQFPLRSCGTPYRGINVWMLWGAQAANGYSSNYWLTYKKALELGGQVRKGERATTAVFASKFDKKETVNGAEVTKFIPFLKAYSVFNADQIDGLPERFKPAVPVIASPVELLARSEEFFTASGAKFSHGGNRAYYRPSTDEIQLPEVTSFESGEAYASVKAHELIHWTGHDSRLGRPINNRHGDDGYAREELVAELGAAYLCGLLGISNEPRPDHASYLAAWIQVLKADKRAIVQASSKAQGACDYLLTLTGTAAFEEEAPEALAA